METPWTEGIVRGAAVVHALIVFLLATSAVLWATGCGPRPSSAPAPTGETEAIGWRTLGSWSGRGSVQTESFLYEGSVLRVRWETKNAASTGTGTFRLTFLSAVSGRQLAVAADHRGAGEGESYIPEEPRPAYFLVESEDLDWSFSVEEGEAGTVRQSSSLPPGFDRPLTESAERDPARH